MRVCGGVMHLAPKGEVNASNRKQEVEKMGLTEMLVRLLGGTQAPMAGMGFGPNSVYVGVRRAKRDRRTNESLRDAEGNVIYEEKLEEHWNHNVTCTEGIKSAKDRLFNSATAEPIVNYIALSESTIAPSAAHTQLQTEITLSGLARATAAYSVAGCADGECILSKTFIATANVAAVVLMGLLNAASTGDLYFEATIASVSLVTDDQLTAKWDKITIS
jgi:hypothetical protein